MAVQNYEKCIRDGDTVTIYYIAANWSPETVEIIHTPSGEGDLWQFQRKDGTVFALNPYSPNFHSMTRVERRHV